MKKGIIQLRGAEGQEIALFTYELLNYKEEQAVNIIENAIEAAYQKDEEGKLEDNDVLCEAVEQLRRNFNIHRIIAGEATTDRL